MEEILHKKFDIDKGGDSSIDYTIMEEQAFPVIKGEDNTFAIKVIEPKEPSVKGEHKGEKGQKVGFSASAHEYTQHQFILELQKSNGELFNSSTDHSRNITLTVKDGRVDVYKITNLFGQTGVPSNSNQFTITLPRESDYYSNAITIVGSLGNHRFAIDKGNVKSGSIALKLQNNAPEITYHGADGSSDYSDTNKTFDIRTQTGFVTIFTSSSLDSEMDFVSSTIKWTLYNGDTELPNATISNYSGSAVKLSTWKYARIKPST